MNIPEAIEILTKERKDHHSFSTDIIGKAEQLGIEALKEIHRERIGAIPFIGEQLPGETED